MTSGISCTLVCAAALVLFPLGGMDVFSGISSTSSPVKTSSAEASPPRYEFLRLLGQGVSGEVFLVKRDDGSMVAVKRLFPGEMGRAQVSLRKSQLINHPNVVRAIETYQAPDSEGTLRDHLVLEFVEGDTLAQTPVGFAAKKQDLRYALEFLDAIMTAYRCGLAYVDLTTFNIMVNSERVVVIDLKGFEYVHDGMLCRMETAEQWLYSVLEVTSEILKRGRWEQEELQRVLADLTGVIRDGTEASWHHGPLSEAPADMVLGRLNAMSQKLYTFKEALGESL